MPTKLLSQSWTVLNLKTNLAYKSRVKSPSLRVEGAGDRMSHKSECIQWGRSDTYLNTFHNHTVCFLWLLT